MDNCPLSSTGPIGCGRNNVYYHDQAGNRIAVETLNGTSQESVQRMSYTAARQLYFSLTATYAPGNYDVNWH